MLKEGKSAPAFKTTDADGNTVKLADFRGQKVVLYFYPKDDTPGCTKEACSFRDAFADFKKRGIKIHCDFAPAQVYGDADRLGQVITNLLTNAIHYNKPNGEIRVSTRGENGAAIVAIADTGQGIADEDLPHIFERFYRADKSRSRAAGRSGLGLAISKAIVDAHGGTIEVTSQPGEGTTFTVRLRVEQLR